MDPISIIEKYYDKDSKAYIILVTHGKMVQKKALEIAEHCKHLNPDIEFIKQAAMLHDIGICYTNAPGLDCHGEGPYITHGIKGREILEKEGLHKLALVCERHTGSGLSSEDIAKEHLDLPSRDMIPLSVEEKIICVADKFFSKHPEKLTQEKSIEEIKAELLHYGEDKVQRFEQLLTDLGL